LNLASAACVEPPAKKSSPKTNPRVSVFFICE
jgi:hypothetical protein